MGRKAVDPEGIWYSMVDGQFEMGGGARTSGNGGVGHRGGNQGAKPLTAKAIRQAKATIRREAAQVKRDRAATRKAGRK